MNLRCAPLLALLVPTLLVPAPAGREKEYAGQYVLRLGVKNFLVLNLLESKGKLAGTLSRPRHASIGSSFSHIGSEIIDEPISSAVIKQGHLHLVVKNPYDASDTDAFDLTLLQGGHALLQLSSFPIDPWQLARVPDQPQLSVTKDWDAGCVYVQEGTEQSNPVMQRIMDQDQRPRQAPDLSHADWAKINKEDEERRKQVRVLLARGDLHSGKDFEQAAFIFQHGSTPDDYLLAHTLAMIAIAHGNSGALWIATATLDRYLNSIKRPQIYGTQFYNTKGASWIQEPYNRALISDELRRQLGVPSQAVQQKQLDNSRSQGSSRAR